MLKQQSVLKTQKLLDAKLQEDNLYTLLYAYVGTFAPTPDLMIYTGKKQSADEIKTSIDQSLQKLRDVYQVNLAPTAQQVFDLVSKEAYASAKSYLRERVQKVEREIKALK